jgi:hypothetical protein
MDTSPTSDAPNLDQFAQQLIAEDELGSVVRAHLHIEYHLDQLIEASVPNPGALHTLDLDYSGRVRLLSVLGFSDALTKPLHNLGGLRNMFAHKLTFKLTPERMRSLYETLDPTGKQIVHLAYDNTRKKHSGPKRHPKKMWSLDPKDIFSLLASSIRVMVLIAHKEKTGSFPVGSVPARYFSTAKISAPVTV